jgi:hypothetical protein
MDCMPSMHGRFEFVKLFRACPIELFCKFRTNDFGCGRNKQLFTNLESRSVNKSRHKN